MMARPDHALPRVSVGLPVRNGAPYLAEALAALRNQTYSNFDVVICDNASTDATAAICASVKDDPRFTYLSFDVNAGAAENFNRAFRLTTGPLFCWAAHDDRVRPEFIERCVGELTTHTDAAMCVTSVTFIDDRGEPVGVCREGEQLASNDLATRLRSYLRRPAWFLAYGVARRSILAETQLLPPCYGTDVVLLWEILLQHRFCVVTEPMLEYRRLPEAGRSAESKAAGMAPSAGTNWHRWGSWKLWANLWRTTSAATIPVPARVIARRELVLWLGTRYWRRLLFNDWYSELRIAHARGWRIRRAVALALMILLRPLHCCRNLRRGRQLLREDSGSTR